MAIEFHCEHCNHQIKAPDEAGGRTGRCPHCQNATYIPRPDEGEYDLAPLDDSEERKRRQAAAEAAALQKSLLHERSMPGEKPGRPAPGKPGQGGGFVSPTKQVTGMIVQYIEALSGGKLEKAEAIASELAPHKATVLSILDEIARDEIGSFGLPSLPKPLLVGFLKQLRQKL